MNQYPEGLPILLSGFCLVDSVLLYAGGSGISW